VTDLHQTVVMVTHDPVAAAHTDHAIFLVGGRLTAKLDAPNAAQVVDVMAQLRRAA
jgi:putative ABC transport system ATP-binding protein